MTGGRGADIAIEAVGKPETWHWAVDMVRRGGTVNFFGGCPSDSRISLDTNLLHYSEITCKASSITRPLYIQKALDLVSDGHITAQRFRQPRGAADQPAGSDAAPDEPQRAPEDGDHSLMAASGQTSRTWRPRGLRALAGGDGGRAPAHGRGAATTPAGWPPITTRTSTW